MNIVLLVEEWVFKITVINIIQIMSVKQLQWNLLLSTCSQKKKIMTINENVDK